MSDEIKNNVIDQETAEFEFERFCDAWGIDFDESTFNEEEKVSYEKLKRQIINAIRNGSLSVQDDGTIKYIISKFSKDHAGKEIKIEMPEGKDVLSMNGYKDNQEVSKNFALLGSIIKKPPQFFNGLKIKDINVIQAVVTLFLAV